MKLSSVLKKRRNQQHSDLLSKIQKFELFNKINPNSTTSSQLDHVRHELQLLLISHHNKLHKWKAQLYCHGNKAGKLLANQVKERSIKQKIPFIHHPVTGARLFNPKEIANAFQDYYNSLHNLKDDETTP